MQLTRDLCYAATADAPPRFDARPLQVGMHGDAYLVAIASMLLNRTRYIQAAPVLAELLRSYPTPEALCRAEDVSRIVRPCGLRVRRARQLTRFATEWLGLWDDLRELTGVGLYVADAVSVFCFGCTELQSSNQVLHNYAKTLAEQAS